MNIVRRSQKEAIDVYNSELECVQTYRSFVIHVSRRSVNSQVIGTGLLPYSGRTVRTGADK